MLKNKQTKPTNKSELDLSDYQTCFFRSPPTYIKTNISTRKGLARATDAVTGTQGGSIDAESLNKQIPKDSLRD